MPALLRVGDGITILGPSPFWHWFHIWHITWARVTTAALWAFRHSRPGLEMQTGVVRRIAAVGCDPAARNIPAAHRLRRSRACRSFCLRPTRIRNIAVLLFWQILTHRQDRTWQGWLCRRWGQMFQ